MSGDDNIQDYNDEPVTFCARCYSLKIKYEETIDADYCTECGSLNTMTAPIEEWERLYADRYGKKYIEKGTDPRKSPTYNFSLDKLRDKVFGLSNLKQFIKELYPRFPFDNLTRTDAVFYLFNKIIKDCRLDELKLKLIKYLKG